MIPRNAQPIANDGPYKRIDLWGPRKPKPVEPVDPSYSYYEWLELHKAEVQRRVEAKRIWKITRQIAEGTNITGGEQC